MGNEAVDTQSSLVDPLSRKGEIYQKGEFFPLPSRGSEVVRKDRTEITTK